MDVEFENNDDGTFDMNVDVDDFKEECEAIDDFADQILDMLGMK